MPDCGVQGKILFALPGYLIHKLGATPRRIIANYLFVAIMDKFLDRLPGGHDLAVYFFHMYALKHKITMHPGIVMKPGCIVQLKSN